MNDESKSDWITMSGVKNPGPLTHPGYQRAGSYDQPEITISEKLGKFVLRHITRHYVSSVATIRPPRFAVVQGPQGDGKTSGVRVTCSRHGVDVILAAAPEFAGETENAVPAALTRLREAVHKITAREGRPILICLDDFDLSNAARLGSTEYTVNTQMLTGALQHLADTGALRTAQGHAVPIVMTGNDFTPMRSSLLRPGRAEFFEHALGLDDKCKIVATIYGVSDAKGVRRLVSAHSEEPIAFFAGLPARALDEELDLLIAQHGLDFRAIETQLNHVGRSVDLAHMQKLAAEAVACRARNYIGRR